MPRHDVDVVVTEHGAADPRGLTLRERTLAIMAVAAPQHLPALEGAFAVMVDRFGQIRTFRLADAEGRPGPPIPRSRARA